MKTLVSMLMSAVFVLLFACWAPAQGGILDWQGNGHIELSVFPVNNEHNTYGTLEIYSEIRPKDIRKTFFFVQPMVFLGDSIPKIRYDNSYITGLHVGVGYISSVKLGIGYELSERWDVRAVYWNTREPTGYEGDWTGVQFRYVFGKK